MKPALLAASLAVVLAGCKMPGEKQDFNQLEDEFVYGSLALSPVSATSAGYHQHKGKRLDEMLDDYSPSGINEQRRFYFDLHDRIGLIKQESLDAEQRADYRLMDDQVNLALLEINHIRGWAFERAIRASLVWAASFAQRRWTSSRSCGTSFAGT